MRSKTGACISMIRQTTTSNPKQKKSGFKALHATELKM